MATTEQQQHVAKVAELAKGKRIAMSTSVDADVALSHLHAETGENKTVDRS